MAEGLEDGEFWLPSQFLTDDEMVTEKVNCNVKSAKSLFPCEYGYGFGGLSDFSSPVESVIGSTETESDEEEDLLAEVTRQMARTMVNDDVKSGERLFISETNKGWVTSGSPQSILSPIGDGTGSNRVGLQPVNWDLMCAAAEVARIRANEEAMRFSSMNERGILGAPRNRAHVSVPVKSHQESLYYQKLQAFHFQQLRNQQLMKQQALKRNELSNQLKQQQNQCQGFVNGRVRGNPSVHPMAQTQSQSRLVGSGMRAMFLGDGGRKRECAGTGVFLPRRPGAVTESRKKQGCPTVLLPARVVQALNLDLDGPQAPSYGGFAMANGNGMRGMNGRVQRPPPSSFRHEQMLPKEWSY